jgi:putative SOS response-associated peptidase YedK
MAAAWIVMGLWTWCSTSVGQRMPTCAIVTCSPNQMMAEIHDRMPVILRAARRDEWLDPKSEVANRNGCSCRFRRRTWKRSRYRAS